jgi:hypothetical protein
MLLVVMLLLLPLLFLLLCWVYAGEDASAQAGVI